MKFSKIIATVIAVLLMVCPLEMVAFATSEHECGHCENEITFNFHNDVSSETMEKVIAHFNGEENNIAQARGLTCTLFGHKLETGTTDTITHKVRSSAPRCLLETYSYEVCTRCDEYSEYTLLYSEYINCCS
jgi:hypothetical protein